MKTHDRLSVYRVVDIPLKEVSGVCLGRGAGGELALVAIGDRASVAAWFLQPAHDMAPLDWQTADISHLEESRLPERDPDIEAVCADGLRRILVLQESPPRGELIDASERRIVAAISLGVPGDDHFARAWADPAGSRGEGAVFLPDGHLLVAKEKDPSAFIEFGAPGSRPNGLARGGALEAGAPWAIEPGDHDYVALAVWSPDKALRKACQDFSDLEIGPDGRLYVLSDKSGSIVRLGDLPAAGGDVTAVATWQLGDLDGKPEGLAFSPNGRAIVALDSRKARHNLLLFEPPIAAG